MKLEQTDHLNQLQNQLYIVFRDFWLNPRNYILCPIVSLIYPSSALQTKNPKNPHQAECIILNTICHQGNFMDQSIQSLITHCIPSMTAPAIISPDPSTPS